MTAPGSTVSVSEPKGGFGHGAPGQETDQLGVDPGTRDALSRGADIATQVTRPMIGSRIGLKLLDELGEGDGLLRVDQLFGAVDEALVERIVVDGVELTSDLKRVDEVRKEVGMVFQHFNLFPHMTVLDNIIEAPVHVLGMDRQEAINRARNLLSRFDSLVAVNHFSFENFRSQNAFDLF